MTKLSTNQKFKQFQKSIESRQFNDITFLEERAATLLEEDEALAKRILLRVTNLKRKTTQQKLKPVKTKSHEQLEMKQPSLPTQEVKEKKSSTEEPTITAKTSNDLSRFQLVKNKVQDTILNISAKKLFTLLVVLPTFIFAFYQNFIATERFDSQALVIVQQPDGMATMDASMALLSGLGMSNTGVSDTELVKAYIYSNDMLVYLDETINLRDHYSDDGIDFFSRLHSSDTQEDFIEFYQKHVSVFIDVKSSVIHINAQGFSPEYAQRLAQSIVNRAEWYINSIGHQLAEAQLEFIKGEHQLVEEQLGLAQRDLLQFQQRYNLLDPTAEGMAMQQITYTLEGQISAKEAELRGVKGIMSSQAPQVVTIKNELEALREQLENERSKLSQDSDTSIPVSEILASFTDLKIKMELALKAYTSSQISLEKSRIEAYRQLKYLVVVEQAILPESSRYPEVLYNVTLFTIILSMMFAIGRVFVLVVKELG